MAIGGVVAGASADGVFFGGTGGILSQDSTNFKWHSGLILTAPAATDVPLLIKGAAGQSANLQEWRKSDDTLFASLGNNGILNLFGASDQLYIQNTGGGQGGVIGRDTTTGGLKLSATIGNLILQTGGSASTIQLLSNSGIIETRSNSSGGAGIQFKEMTAPTAPAVDKGIVFMQDNGSGKTQLCVRFNTGAIQVIATEP